MQTCWSSSYRVGHLIKGIPRVGVRSFRLYSTSNMSRGVRLICLDSAGTADCSHPMYLSSLSNSWAGPYSLAADSRIVGLTNTAWGFIYRSEMQLAYILTDDLIKHRDSFSLSGANLTASIDATNNSGSSQSNHLICVLSSMVVPT
jgi:hypothetical protein